MKVGDNVRTIPWWTSVWGIVPIYGQVVSIEDVGPNPYHPERRVKVALAVKSRPEMNNCTFVWLALSDLQLDD